MLSLLIAGLLASERNGEEDYGKWAEQMNLVLSLRAQGSSTLNKVSANLAQNFEQVGKERDRDKREAHGP